MIDDPVQDLIDFVHLWGKRLLLSLLNEDAKIEPGETMFIPNQYHDLTLYFERLETEPDPRRVAQLTRRRRERRLQKQLAGSVQFVSSLFASIKIK